MNIAVTGGAGFIGSHLVDDLLKQGHKVVAIDNLSTGNKENIHPAAIFAEQDILDEKALKDLFEKEQIEGVFHLAAIPRVPISVEDPAGTSQVNITGTVSVFKAAVDAGVKRIVFASSSSVYGNQEKLPLVEEMTASPVSPYGLQKLVGEQFAHMFSTMYKLPVVSLRYFNVYGPRIDVESGYSLVLGKFLKQKSQGEQLTILGNGEQTRAFCYVTDVVTANIAAMESAKIQGGEVINVGGADSHSINYLAELIGGEKQYLDPRVGDVLHTMADTTKAKELLDWESKVSFEDGIQQTKEWFENN